MKDRGVCDFKLILAPAQMPSKMGRGNIKKKVFSHKNVIMC